MKPRMVKQISWVLSLILGWTAANASEALEELRIKKENIFEFSVSPTVKVEGDRVSIAFESKGFCDATVVIENVNGKIVRHLASGVLGPKAPPPFIKSQKSQTLVWDGKNDHGQYVDDKENHVVRVSLGLKPRFERTLFWSPHKRIGMESPLLAPAPEGVYMYGSWDGLDFLRLYDHDGNYVRTIYPYPAGKVREVKGLHWKLDLRSNREQPRKEGYLQSTLLNSGINAGFDSERGYGSPKNPVPQPDMAKYQAPDPGGLTGPAVTALAAHGDRLALASLFLNRLRPDGTSGGMALRGPTTSLAIQTRGGKVFSVSPRAMAFAPDGKTLYLTNFLESWLSGRGLGHLWAHGVAKLDYAAGEDAQMEVFKGKFSFDRKDAGTGADSFNSPIAVACDPQGNVYVADFLNDRVQVFDAGGKFLKSLPTERPAQVHVSRKDGSIYVFSWGIHTQFGGGVGRMDKPLLTKFKSLSEPKVVAAYPLPLISGNGQVGLGIRASVDDWAQEPTIWLVPGDAWMRTSSATVFQFWERASIKLLREKNGKLVEIRDFGAEVSTAFPRHKPAVFFRQRLYVDPLRELLYVAEGSFHNKATPFLLEVDPSTGKSRQIEVPFDAEDFCFDLQGHAYLRTGHHVARFDSNTWREVPWDYGEEAKLTYADERSADSISALRTPGHRATARNHNGGMAVSAIGSLIVTTCSDQNKAPEYIPRQYPGRYRHGEIHIFDKHGKVLFEDAVPGLNVLDGIGIDRDDNIYVMSQAQRLKDGKAFLNPKSEVLIKFAPGKAKIVSQTTKCLIPLGPGLEPKRPPDIFGGQNMDNAWVENAEWFYGGVGFNAGGCVCWNGRFDLDYLGRSFVPEIDHYSIAVLDSAGNLILRIGQYGNIEDGKPLVAEGGPPTQRGLGGDEVALFHALNVATHTDRRLFIADQGNARLLSVKLEYQTEKRIPLNAATGD